MKTTGRKPYFRNTLLIPEIALALALLVVGLIIAYTLYLEYVRIEQRERERLATQAKVIDENLARQLEGVYRALEEIRKELPLWRGRHDMKTANFRLRVMADTMPGIRTFLIADAQGTIISANREQVVGQNIRFREYFQAPLKNRNYSTLHISPPFKTILGNFVINVSLMTPGAKGEFDGIVSAALDPEYFTILMGSVLYAPDMWAALAHWDGKQFLMVPDRPGMAGMDLAKPGSFFTRHRESGWSANVLTGVVYATGDERMMAMRTIRHSNVPSDKPLVVAVGRNMGALYADWRREALGKVALFGVLVLAMTAAMYFYQRRQRKFDTISVGIVEELQQAKEAALRATEAKSRFLATVAHEFRTPLSLLTSSTDILDRYGERLNREERTQQHEHIRSAAYQMSSLVDSVLTFNRLEAHPPRHNPVNMDLWRFCQRVGNEVRAACSNGHVFSVLIAENCGTPLLDEVLFRRVVENLLTNAFRYTPAGGTVTLQVYRENDRLQLMVTDTGIGIPEEDQNRIFESFYRCRNVEARRGMGLGLSIVHEALLHMGGTISVASAVDEGTTMLVEIPVVDRRATEKHLTCTPS